jgi:hypothetical protein
MSSGKLEREIKNVRRDIETLGESLDLNRTRQDSNWPTREEIQGTLVHTTWCMEELQRLKAELERLLKEAEK